MSEETFTTHEIARFCDVDASSVMRWINDKKLAAQTTMGGHHRVTRENVVELLERLGIDLPEELVKRKRVFIVEDDEETAKLVARWFSRRGEYEVETCGDGINALIRIGKLLPDLIILDIVIPKLDGIQVCRVLRERPETRGMKIIAVSGQKLPCSEKRLAELKLDGFFRKPLNLKELGARAAELLGGAAPRRPARAER